MNTNFHFPTAGISVDDNALLLSIDDNLLPIKHNICLYLTKPTVQAEPVLAPEPRESIAPDNTASLFYGTVIETEGRFQMWYYACHWESNPDWPPALQWQLAKFPGKLFMGPLCYAESEDGLNWTKPELGQVLFKGSSANNALALPHALVSAATVIRDDAETDPARRYKMMYEFWPDFSDDSTPAPEGVATTSGIPTCAAAVSSDGIHWTVIHIPYEDQFLEQSSFYQHDGKYILNSHYMGMMLPGEGGTPRGRQAFARFAYDFDKWVPGHVESFTLPEPADFAQRGIDGHYDQVHLGVGAASFGTVCVGLYGIWHNAKFKEEFNDISCDFGLVVSNDGLRFREPVKGHVFLTQQESPVTPAPNGNQYNTNLCQANGILNVGDETRIYHGRWRNAGTEGEEVTGAVEDFYGEVALATLPRDRWGGLGLFPDQVQGFVWSAPIVMPEGDVEMLLNADWAQNMRVEIADERFGLLPGYSGDLAGRVEEDGLDCLVRWAAGNFIDFGGQTVRFKFTLAAGETVSPKLYAVKLRRGLPYPKSGLRG